MRITLRWPQEVSLVPSRFSYEPVGATQDEQPVAGFDNDHNRVCLGTGEEVYRAACRALLGWEQFPRDWVRILPGDAPLRKAQRVAMVARAFGLIWISGAELVYTVDAPRRFGFAYGTLETHIECGEERFLIEWLPDDTVWYDLRAFSRPRHWLIRLGYPLARRLQRRFVHDSQKALQQAIARQRRR